MAGAVVLTGVAVLAVTGCVRVHGDKAGVEGTLPSGPSQPAEAVPDDEGVPPVTARPSLREVPSRPSPARTEDPRKAAAPPPAPGTARPAPGGGEAPARAGAPVGGQEPPAPRPSALPRLPSGPGRPGVCDLGRRYGGWAEDSTPVQACERAWTG